MSHPPRVGALARIAAALVALVVSGAPRVLALHAPVELHRCACRAHAAGERECDCAICRKSFVSAQASDDSLPPCHRAGARDAVARRSARGPRDGACLEGTCGNGGAAPVTVAGLEPFCLPVTAARAVEVVRAADPPFAARPAERSSDPETPPPRAS